MSRRTDVCERILLSFQYVTKFNRREESLCLASDAAHVHPKSPKDQAPSSKCLLFAPAEYFEDNATRIQFTRTLSSSFRIHTTLATAPNESTDEVSNLIGAQNPSPPILTQTTESSGPLVYVLCVPISTEVESEWRGADEDISDHKNFKWIAPLNTDWKTTSIFLFTQQTSQLERVDQLFKERLSKINVQQSDLYNFETKPGQILQKRSCFEQVDRAMRDLAHSILSLSNCITSNVEQFEKLILQLNTRAYVVSHSRTFSLCGGVDKIFKTRRVTTFSSDKNRSDRKENRDFMFSI